MAFTSTTLTTSTSFTEVTLTGSTSFSETSLTTSTDFDLVGNKWNEAAELLSGGNWDSIQQINWEDLD
mgnify:CR=1 FL=1|tara:strand:- start:770 stop:973 length:204 start_codon:yes stop_codon:yes gene_type:complete